MSEEQTRIADLPFWYDRLPHSYGLQFASTVGPHPETDRLEYLALPGENGMIEGIGIYLRRETAAEAVGAVTARVYFNLEEILVFSYGVGLFDNNVGALAYWSLGVPMTMIPNEGIVITTEDLSTGGTILYQIGYKIVGFKALGKIHYEPSIIAPKKDIQEPEEKPWWWPF